MSVVSMGDVATAARELQDLAPLIESTRRVRQQPDASGPAHARTNRGGRRSLARRRSQLIPSSSRGPNIPKVTLVRALTERADLYLKRGRLDLALADAQRDLQVARELQRDKQYSAYTGRALAVLARCQQARAESSQARATAARGGDQFGEDARGRSSRYAVGAPDGSAVARSAARPYVSTRHRYSIGPRGKRLEPPASQRHLDDEEDRDGQHQVERGPDLAPQAEAPVIEQQ